MCHQHAVLDHFVTTLRSGTAGPAGVSVFSLLKALHVDFHRDCMCSPHLWTFLVLVF